MYDLLKTNENCEQDVFNLKKIYAKMNTYGFNFQQSSIDVINNEKSLVVIIRKFSRCFIHIYAYLFLGFFS